MKKKKSRYQIKAEKNWVSLGCFVIISGKSLPIEVFFLLFVTVDYRSVFFQFVGLTRGNEITTSGAFGLFSINLPLFAFRLVFF